MQFDFVHVARQDKQLAVAVRLVCDLRVPVLGVKEDAVCFAPEPCKSVKEKQCMAERCAVGGIEAVRIVGPIGRRLCRC